MITLLFSIFIFNTTVQHIDFQGNKSISARNLKQELLSRKGDEYNELNLTYDVNGITIYYRSQGFFYTTVSPIVQSHEKGITITYNINEGVRKKIEVIVITGSTRDSIDHVLQIHEGDFFIKSNIRATEDSIETFFNNHGYPFVKVRSFISADSAILSFNIDKGMRYYIRKIMIKGLVSCNPRVIRRELEIKTGELFTKKSLVRSQQNIYGLGFFSTVDVELNKHGIDSLDLVFNLRELKSRIMNFGIGISTPLDFLFSFGIEELNLFNAGHRFQVRPSFQINIDQEWNVKLDGRYTIPHITDIRLTLSVLPFIWYENLQDYNLQTRGNELRVTKVLSDNLLFNLFNQYKYVELHRKTSIPIEDSLTGITNSLTGQVLIDSRDDFFNPRTGWYITPLVKLAGGPFGGANDYLQYEFEIRSFLPLLKNTIAQRFRLGYIYPLNGVAFYELYSLGGQYSIRGYAERSIGPRTIGNDHYGHALANYNFECRFHLPYNFGMVGFFDCGYINDQFNVTDTDYLKASAGAGLRYHTPIGPARFDIGFPLDHQDRVFYLGIYHIF